MEGKRTGDELMVELLRVIVKECGVAVTKYAKSV